MKVPILQYSLKLLPHKLNYIMLFTDNIIVNNSGCGKPERVANCVVNHRPVWRHNFKMTTGMQSKLILVHYLIDSRTHLLFFI